MLTALIILSTVVIVALKAFNVITWPWKWVLSPLWIPALAGALLLALLLFIGKL